MTSEPSAGVAGAGCNPALGARQGGLSTGGPGVGAQGAGNAGGAVTLLGADVKSLLEGVKDLTAQVAQMAQATAAEASPAGCCDCHAAPERVTA